MHSSHDKNFLFMRFTATCVAEQDASLWAMPTRMLATF